MCIFFVNVRFVKNFGCHYNQSGLLKSEILGLGIRVRVRVRVRVRARVKT